MDIRLKSFSPNESHRTIIENLLFQLSGKQRSVNLEQHDGSFLIGAFEGDSLVGFAQIFIFRKLAFTLAILEDVIVDESLRGKGIGKKLVSASISLAKEKGAAHINLTVRPERIEAEKLYKSSGFVKEETNVFRLRF